MPRKSLHPTFQKKRVIELICNCCGSCVCRRGMKAILLADTAVELYSTDLPPFEATDLVPESYQTEKCKCRIQDVACLKCGNVVGYNVVLPCRPCMESCNNGHLWMFHSNAIDAMDRLDYSGESILLWGQLVERDESGVHTPDHIEECIR